MNAIVVFCHFCEQHGPSVVMCTQPYRQIQPRSGLNQEFSTVDTHSISRNASHPGLYGVGSAELGCTADTTPGPFVFGQEPAPPPINLKNSPSTSQQFAAVGNPTCRACSFSSRDEPGLLSQDQAASMTFISTQWPKDPDLFTYVRAACQRSLSCEVFPEPEGAFYFGDEVNGHVVSYNFHVKDSQARGFQSRFSILVMSWDRMYLLTLWPFLISNLSRMATRICTAAEHVYETEVANAGSSSSSHRATNSVAYWARGATPPPHPPPAGPIPLAFAGQAIATGAVAGGAAVNPVFRQRRAADSDMRSLADLTRDDQIFYRIHAWFTWLLRAGGRRWTVIPSLMTPADEDALIEQEERQRAVITLGELTSGGISTSAPSGSSFSSFNLSEWNSSADEGTIALLILTRMLHSLGEKAFGQLVQHVAVGNQTVVQPLTESALGPLVVNAIGKLLPRGCRRKVVLSPEYVPTFQCNLLSLTAEAQPPETGWTTSDGVLFVAVVQILKESSDSSIQTAMERSDDTSMKYAPLVNTLHFKLDSKFPSTDPLFTSIRTAPLSTLDEFTFQMLTPVQPAVSNLSTYTQHVIKLLSLNPPLPPSSLDLALNAIRQEWINRARLLYAFKRCQGPIMSGEETTRRWAGVLAAIDCTTVENANVARFWQGALSQHSRRNTCHSRRRIPNSTSASRKSSRCSSTADLAAALAAASLAD